MATVFRTDALQVQQIEDRLRELLQQLLVERTRAAVDQLADLGAARSLPIPGMSRSSPPSRRDTGSG